MSEKLFTMRKRSNKLSLFVLTGCLLTGLFSCTKDLDKQPTNGVTTAIQYETVAGYKQSLATIYGSLVYTPTSTGSNGFLRDYWNMQEYPTDEAVSTWNDDGNVAIYHQLSWSADLPAVAMVYTDMMNTITLANSFIIESADTKIEARGFDQAAADSVKEFRAEARFMRAYAYSVLMDTYGNPPFATDTTLAAGATPKQIDRKDLFNFIESELMDIAGKLPTPGTNEWGRADQGADWALLSRIYLNAKVYTGTARYTDAITYCNKIIESGQYALMSHYSWLFMGDNSQGNKEFILPIVYQNNNEVNWGGTNWLVLGPAGVTELINGLSGSWNEFRFTQSIPKLFPSFDTTIDKRALFYTEGQTLEATTITNQTNGFSSYKFRNINRDGSAITQNNTFGNIADIDFPIFRLPEIYLTYAESVLRGGSGGNVTTALGYINQLRGRAYANDPSSKEGNITAAALTTDFVLDEKAREMYWEAQRRTDLIRYDRLTTDTYLWDWKGGSLAGNAVSSKYNLFPIPTADLLANPNLKNTNY
ncbi:RagB/SusD family nutrient uptake outer membrane protein [Arachidicoccus ginsenosidivorans]|jgi:hypothetical protein